MTNPTSEQPREHSAIEGVRTPLLAALGAGNLATQAVVDAVNKAKERMNEGSEAARKNFDEIPHDFESLRERLDPAELRKAVDEYTDAAWKLYNKLASSGEQAWDSVSSQPQIKRALDQLEEALESAQGRFEGVSVDARERFDEMLGMVTKRTRSTGEKAARTVQEVASDAAEKVEDLGDDLAHEARSTTRKAASKTAPSKNTGSTSGSTTTRSTSGSSGSSRSGSAASSSSSSTGSTSNSTGSSSNSTKKSTGGNSSSTK